jgi:2,5-diketo-D-gluconate reductase B
MLKRKDRAGVQPNPSAAAMLFVEIHGAKMPALGLGTWQLSGAECERAVRVALDIGYRHIDTAEMYGNEAEIGRAIAASGVSRKSLFITTKLWTNHLRAKDVTSTAEASLKRLRTDYVDLLLIHWPNAAVPMGETLGAMMQLKAAGKVKAIGVSNFSVGQMNEALTKHKAPIACNQIEYHLLLNQRPILDYAHRHKMAVVAYCPLARGKLVNHRTLLRVGQKHGRSASQIALRWLVQQPGVAAIPKSSNEKNLRSNFAIFDFALDETDMAELNRLPGNTRLIAID